MTTPDPSLTPERDEAVRRLLGSVGSDAPALPEHVADRLDARLTDLVAERDGRDAPPAPPAAGVIDLAARRRRRVVSAAFVAAAAVVAVGIGVPLLNGDDNGDNRLTTATDQAADRSATTSPATASADALSVPDAAPKAPQPQLGGRAAGEGDRGRRAVHVLHADHLRADLLALRRQVARVATATTYSTGRIRTAPGFTCAHAGFGKGQLFAVRYDGAPAVAAFRAPTASTQVAEVLQCGTAKVLGSVTLPPPR